jgi:phosphoglycolate phosphatase
MSEVAVPDESGVASEASFRVGVVGSIMTRHSESDHPLGSFDAIVWDLDGTLVRLAVDWDRVTDDVAEVFESAGIAPDDRTLWELMNAAGSVGLRSEVEAVVAEYERTGAQESDRLRLADAVGRVDAEAVCSLNCAAACRVALDAHGLGSSIDAVVGRDTVPAQKPDPEPLLEALRRLDVPPSDAVFVGDSESDGETADRAGVAFRHVDDV